MEEIVKTEQEIKLEALQVQVEAKAAELSATMGVKVVPMVFLDLEDAINGEPKIGFLKEPNRVTKENIMDVALQGKIMRARSMALQASIMKECSSPELTSEMPKHDAYVFAAGEKAIEFITIAIDQLKKK